MLRCEMGAFVPYLRCRGEGGCKIDGDRPFCDLRIAVADDPCGDEVGAACSQDKLTYLECRGGKFVEKRKCGGPDKCATAIDGTVSCDDTVGSIGDLCGVEGAWACTADRKNRLACKNGKLAKDRVCPKPCVVDEGFVVCH